MVSPVHPLSGTFGPPWLHRAEAMSSSSSKRSTAYWVRETEVVGGGERKGWGHVYNETEGGRQAATHQLLAIAVHDKTQHITANEHSSIIHTHHSLTHLAGMRSPPPRCAAGTPRQWRHPEAFRSNGGATRKKNFSADVCDNVRRSYVMWCHVVWYNAGRCDVVWCDVIRTLIWRGIRRTVSSRSQHGVGVVNVRNSESRKAEGN